MIKKFTLLFLFLSTFAVADEYKINKITVNQIDGKRNILAEENSDYYSNINNLDDFIIIVNVVGKDPKKDYFQANQKLILHVYNKTGKEIYTDSVDASYINMGGQYHWFLVRRKVISCGQFKLVAELKGKSNDKIKANVDMACGE